MEEAGGGRGTGLEAGPGYELPTADWGRPDWLGYELLDGPGSPLCPLNEADGVEPGGVRPVYPKCELPEATG